MNAKWLKEHALTIGFIAVFLALLGGVIWLQQQASSKMATVNANLEEQLAQLGQLLKSKTAPSHENIAIVKNDRNQVDQLYGELLKTVGRDIEVPTDLQPVGFLQLMASSFSRLRQAADTAGVKLHDGFAFGFGRYAGPPPTLPARNLPDQDTKRVLALLVKQLQAIDQISTLLIESHVDEIDQIRRSEVESSGGGNDTLDLPISNDAKALYHVLPFEFQFTASGDALRTFLNSLTKANSFFAVRRVQITGEAPPTEKGPSQSAKPAAPAPTVTATASKHAPLSITVRIDLIEFPSTQPPKKEAGKPRA
jgi:hypothetical protein